MKNTKKPFRLSAICQKRPTTQTDGKNSIETDIWYEGNNESNRKTTIEIQFCSYLKSFVSFLFNPHLLYRYTHSKKNVIRFSRNRLPCVLSSSPLYTSTKNPIKRWINMWDRKWHAYIHRLHTITKNEYPEIIWQHRKTKKKRVRKLVELSIWHYAHVALPYGKVQFSNEYMMAKFTLGWQFSFTFSHVTQMIRLIFTNSTSFTPSERHFHNELFIQHGLILSAFCFDLLIFQRYAINTLTHSTYFWTHTQTHKHIQLRGT